MFQIIFAIISVISSVMQQQQQAKAEKKKAEQIRAKAALDAEKERENQRKKVAQQRVNFVDSGLMFEGTPDSLMIEGQQESENRINQLMNGAEERALAMDEKADKLESQAGLEAATGLVRINNPEEANQLQDVGEDLISVI